MLSRRESPSFTHALIATALLLSGSCAPEPTAVQVSPWLSVSETSYDFGEIPHGAVRTKTFTIQNTGPQRVRLNGIRTQCTCATLGKRILRDGKVVERKIHEPPILDKGSFLMLELEPKDVLEVTMRVDSNLRSPLDHTEPTYSEFVFEPGEAGSIRIAYRFKIRSRLSILTAVDAGGSPAVKLGKFGKDQSAFGVLELAPRDGKTFEISKIDGLDDRLVLKKTEPTVPGGYRWLVELKPDGNPGIFQRYVRFHTDLKIEDEKTGYVCPIKFEGIAVPNLQILPNPRLDYGRFDFSSPTSRSVDFVYRRPSFDPKWSVRKIFVQADVAKADGSGREVIDCSKHFKAGFSLIEKGEMRLTLDYDGKLTARRYEGQVEVTSADEAYDRVVIKFTGYHAARRSGGE